MSTNSQPLIATIYNPHTQSKDALIAGFIARKQKFERLFRDIRDAPMTKPEQHYLIQGIRGMGKTTLLLRIAYEIDNMPGLHERLIPIVFNEEEYGIGSLVDVWERTAQYLGEADAAFADLYDEMTKQYGQEEYEQQAFQTLINALQRKNKKLLLLIDNIGDVLKKLDTQEGQRLREVLLTTPELRLIGATSVAIEQVHDYTKPFYEFFKIIHLDGLSQPEAIDLFLKLGETYHADAVQQLIERQPGRIEAIRRLTGGVIRTMVLLFEILVENDSGSVFRDLEVLLDRVTPLYKHRMDDLPAQQQKIVAALATAWDAANTKELAQIVRLESKVVSAQLKQLINSGLVEKVETNTKNHLYRLEERFFNIWYLMRFGRKTDQRVLWLVRFFQTMFEGDTEWMQERINGHLQAMEIGTLDPEAALFLTTAFARVLKNEEKEDFLKNKTKVYLIKVGRRELADKISYSQLDIIKSLLEKEQYKDAIYNLKRFNEKSINTHLDLALCYLLLDDKKRAEKELMQLFKKLDRMTVNLMFSKIKIISDQNLENEKSQNIDFNATIAFGATISLFLSDIEESLSILISCSEIATEIAGQYFLAKNQDRKVLAMKVLNDIGSFNYISKENEQYVKILKEIMSLWNNKFNEENVEYFSIFQLKETYNLEYRLYKFLPNNQVSKLAKVNIGQTYLKLLLAKKQYHTAYNYFQQEEWQLKDRIKPLYYATLYFLRDEYPTEYLRMGPELKETVDDILAEVAQMAIDYA